MHVTALTQTINHVGKIGNLGIIFAAFNNYFSFAFCHTYFVVYGAFLHLKYYKHTQSQANNPHAH